MILARFRKDPQRDAGRALYGRAAEQSRRPEFYTGFGVADTVDGRFELLALHVFLTLKRLSAEPEARRISQAVVDRFFEALDDSLREMGVGDLSVGKRIRGMAEAFYGRSAAYDAALAGGAPEGALGEALARNVYGSHDAAHAGALAAYVRASIAALAAEPASRVLSGCLAFPIPAPGGVYVEAV